MLAACAPEDGTGGAKATDDGGSGDTRTAVAMLDAVDAIEIVDTPATGVALGWGWNRGDSEPIPTVCVEFVPGEEPAQTRYMTMHEVNDSHELMQSLGMSAEASVKSIGFEASGKAAFAKSANVTSSSSTFVMNAVVQNGVRYASPAPAPGVVPSDYKPAVTERGGTSGSIRLTPEAAGLAADPDLFKRRCGSAFVSAIYGGAKLSAVLSFQSSSRESKEKLSAEMSASGWGARFEGKVSGASSQIDNEDRMDVSIFMAGGKGDAIPADKEDLLAKLQTISLDAYVAPKDFQIAITPYEILSNWPGKVLPDKETEFEELSAYWGAYNTLYDEIQQVLDRPEDYMGFGLGGNGCPIETCASQALALRRVNDRIKALLETPYTNANSDIIGGGLSQAKGERTQAESALQRCHTNHPSVAAAAFAPDLAALKHAQDEVLAGLKRMEEDARICSDKSDECTFKAESYRSPYAFRAQLPAPVDAEVFTADDLIDFNIGHLAKSRCERSANSTGCLSNAQIDEWRARVGYRSVTKAFQPEVFEKVSELPAAAGNAAAGCSAPAKLAEPDRDDVLWYRPDAIGLHGQATKSGTSPRSGS
jgi:hypothetical protein